MGRLSYPSGGETDLVIKKMQKQLGGVGAEVVVREAIGFLSLVLDYRDDGWMVVLENEDTGKQKVVEDFPGAKSKTDAVPLPKTFEKFRKLYQKKSKELLGRYLYRRNVFEAFKDARALAEFVDGDAMIGCWRVENSEIKFCVGSRESFEGS